MVRIPSLSGQESDVAACVASFLESAGIPVERPNGNIVAVSRHFDPSKPTLALDAHLDTVPVNNGYTRDPYDSGNDPDIIYGLGSNDDGGSVVYLPTQNIAVHVSDGHNQHFYERARGEYKPLFIRYKDTAEFVIEKMQNCMAGYLRRTAPKRDKPAKTEHHEKQDPRPQIKKRQRVKVNVQRVTPTKK